MVYCYNLRHHTALYFLQNYFSQLQRSFAKRLLYIRDFTNNLRYKLQLFYSARLGHSSHVHVRNRFQIYLPEVEPYIFRPIWNVKIAVGYVAILGCFELFIAIHFSLCYQQYGRSPRNYEGVCGSYNFGRDRQLGWLTLWAIFKHLWEWFAQKARLPPI